MMAVDAFRRAAAPASVAIGREDDGTETTTLTLDLPVPACVHLDRRDWKHLRAFGLIRWRIYGTRPWVSYAGRGGLRRCPARFILDIAHRPGLAVVYRDSDPFNLRRSNLSPADRRALSHSGIPG